MICLYSGLASLLELPVIAEGVYFIEKKCKLRIICLLFHLCNYWFLDMEVFSLNCHIMKVSWPIFHRCFALNSSPLDLTQVVNVRNENAREKKTFRRGLIRVSCICSCLYYFNSSGTLIFAQVSGGKLKSIHLWRHTHRIYCPHPVSKGQLFFGVGGF